MSNPFVFVTPTYEMVYKFNDIVKETTKIDNRFAMIDRVQIVEVKNNVVTYKYITTNQVITEQFANFCIKLNPLLKQPSLIMHIKTPKDFITYALHRPVIIPKFYVTNMSALKASYESFIKNRI